MDIFKFYNPDNPLEMSDGRIINGIEKIEWTERYRDPDDFKITAPLSSRIDQMLEKGDFIGMVDSSTIMVVESIEINQTAEGQGELMVSGRSMETLLENRPYGAAKFSLDPGYDPYNTWTGPSMPEYANEHYTGREINGNYKSHDFAVLLINEGINPGDISDPNDAWSPYSDGVRLLATDYGLSDPSFGTEERHSGEGDMYSAVIEALQGDNLGFRVERPRRGNNASNFITNLVVYPGEANYNIILTGEGGDIESAQILNTNKDYYNAVYIRTSHVAYMYKNNAITGLDRRTLYLEYSDIDARWEFDGITYIDPDGVLTHSAMWNSMMSACKAKALDALGKHNTRSVASVEVSKALTKYKYRDDFNVGDLIVVEFPLQTPKTRRVLEYVEIQDSNGYVGYPVLEAPRSDYHGQPWSD